MIRFDSLLLAPLLALTTFACGIKPPQQSGAAELRASPVAAAMLTSSDLRNVPVAQVGNEARAVAAPPTNEGTKEIATESSVVDLGEIDEPSDSPVVEPDEVAAASGVVDLGELDDVATASKVIDLGELDETEPAADAKAKSAPPTPK